jgi:sugar transferase (PEP-CTERM system associated)
MPTIFNRYYPVRNLVFLLAEGIFIFSSLVFVSWLVKGSNIFLIDLFDCIKQSTVVAAVFVVSLYFFNLYDLSNLPTLSESFTRIVQAFGFGCIVLAIIYYVVPDLLVATNTFWVAFFLICANVVFLRTAYFYVLRKKLFAQNIVIIGTGKLAAEIVGEIHRCSDIGYKVMAFVGGEPPSFNPMGAPFYRSIEGLRGFSLDNKIDRIIVASDDRRGNIPVHSLIQCKLSGIAVDLGVTFFEKITGKVLVERVDPSWIFFSDGFGFSRWRRVLKGVMDVCIAVPFFVVSLPIMVISAAIIKLESPGPALFSQERVGQRGRIFKLVKLRSMRQDAEKDGPVWALENDTRVTRFGSFMRKTRIDELPQLWNVIKGDMSLVGPRPERPVFVEELEKIIPYYNIRHAAKPGVTGWAQVCYHYGASTEDALRKLEYDLYYLKNLSIPLDLFIVFKTIKTVLFREGSR